MSDDGGVRPTLPAPASYLKLVGSTRPKPKTLDEVVLGFIQQEDPTFKSGEYDGTEPTEL